jgi:hypothetical protein
MFVSPKSWFLWPYAFNVARELWTVKVLEENGKRKNIRLAIQFSEDGHDFEFPPYPAEPDPESKSDRIRPGSILSTTPNVFDNSATCFFPRDLDRLEDPLKLDSVAALNVHIDKCHSEAALWYGVDMYLSVSAERMVVSYIADMGKFLEIAGRDEEVSQALERGPVDVVDHITTATGLRATIGVRTNTFDRTVLFSYGLRRMRRNQRTKQIELDRVIRPSYALGF